MVPDESSLENTMTKSTITKTYPTIEHMNRSKASERHHEHTTNTTKNYKALIITVVVYDIDKQKQHTG